jgi:hypothetical protein
MPSSGTPTQVPMTTTYTPQTKVLLESTTPHQPIQRPSIVLHVHGLTTQYPMANTPIGSHPSSIATLVFQYYPLVGMGNWFQKSMEWAKYKEGGDLDSHMRLFEKIY